MSKTTPPLPQSDADAKKEGTSSPTSREKCVFYDLKHSNNSARVRLWLRLRGGSIADRVETVMLAHDDLDDGGKLAEVNPVGKVPALTTDSGMHLFESFVIMQYLEDRFGSDDDGGMGLVPDAPDDRALVHLLVRVHDVYISSPNCAQPHFSHTQGCMYLDPTPTRYTPARRTMPDPAVRASKLREIYDRLSWLEGRIVGDPYMVGKRFTHADLTWFPTCVFMELLLPYVFDWSPVFHETKRFPRLSGWYGTCRKDEHFAAVRKDIRDVLLVHKADGRFEGVRGVVRSHPELKWKYI